MEFLNTYSDIIQNDFRDCKSIEDLVILLNKVEKFQYSDSPYFKFDRKAIKKKTLTFLLYSRKEKYRSFEIAKKSGGIREIIAPNQSLKRIQRLLLFCLECLYTPMPTATGFIRGRSIVSNAKMHCNKKYVYNIDLENFFPSITFGRVRTVLHKVKQVGLNDEIARIVASLCCKDGVLPQGAPTSPYLSNIICIKLDAIFYNLSKTKNCTYTRYADDITFSSNDPIFDDSFKSKIEEVVTSQGFAINVKKERLQRNNVIDADGKLIRERQEVTGIIVNRKPNVSRIYIRNLRATLHNWESKGYKVATLLHKKYYLREKGFERYNGNIPKLEMVVGGKIEYLGMVRGNEDPIYTNFKLRYDSLCMKDEYNECEINSILLLAEKRGLKAAMDKFYDKTNIGGK